jgi:hypothetical protein
MPFTVSPSSYRGGDYLFQGITNAAGSLTDALKHYQDIADQADQADATMGYLHQQIDPVTGKPVIDDKAFQSFQQHNQRQRAHIGGGIFAGMKLMETLQHLGYANRETLARTNLYQAQAAAANAPAAAPAINQVYNPTTGKYESVFTHGKSAQVLHPQAGTPGSVQYDPTGKAVGFYDNNGAYHPYSAQGPDLSSLFGDQNQPGAAPAAGTGAGGGATGPQPTDQAYSTQGDPGNLPPMYRQQPPGTAAAAPPQGATRGAPQLNEQRIINGQAAYWDGKGWKPLSG